MVVEDFKIIYNNKTIHYTRKNRENLKISVKVVNLSQNEKGV